jgi:two-component system response regulator LytT
MISMLMHDKDLVERNILEKCSKNAIARYSDDQLQVARTENERQLDSYLEKQGLMDAAFLEIVEESGVRISQKVRRQYENSELLVIADDHISPMDYMTPEIRAASLLLRPYAQKRGEEVVEAFFRSFYRSREQEENEKVFMLGNREGKMRIPYSKIYYIEVCGRKIHIRLKDKEYSKYDTMEHIVKNLPKEFVRCHRSFVFNSIYLEKIRLSQNLIYLEDGITIPLSRRYKPLLKEYIKQLITEEEQDG